MLEMLERGLKSRFGGTYWPVGVRLTVPAGRNQSE
jgi:hypothetical protein